MRLQVSAGRHKFLGNDDGCYSLRLTVDHPDESMNRFERKLLWEIYKALRDGYGKEVSAAIRKAVRS